MTIAIVGQTYERARLLAHKLGVSDDVRLCSAASPRALDGLLADRWIVENGVARDVLDVVWCAVRKRPAATVEFAGRGWPKSG